MNDFLRLLVVLMLLPMGVCRPSIKHKTSLSQKFGVIQAEKLLPDDNEFAPDETESLTWINLPEIQAELVCLEFIEPPIQLNIGHVKTISYFFLDIPPPEVV